MTNGEGRRLGRGLSALLGDTMPPDEGRAPSVKGVVEATGSQRTVALDRLRPNPRNPRQGIAEADVAELTQSVRAHGLVQPILVRPAPGSEGGRHATLFEIIAGERRYRAALAAGLIQVPIVIVEADDRKALELALVENVQRADLNPIDEAEGYQALVGEHGYTQADLADTIGKSRAHVTNMLRLLKLPEGVLREVRGGRLSSGHARALVSGRDPEALARVVLARGLSVRDTERLVARAEAEPDERAAAPPLKRTAALARIAERIGKRLAVRADLRERSDGKGELRLSFDSPEARDALLKRLEG